MIYLKHLCQANPTTIMLVVLAGRLKTSQFAIFSQEANSWYDYTAWCSEIGPLQSLDAPEHDASSDVRELISLHQPVDFADCVVSKRNFSF